MVHTSARFRRRAAHPNGSPRFNIGHVLTDA
jgi:hypothetical protein